MKNKTFLQTALLATVMSLGYVSSVQAIIISSDGTWSNPTGTATVTGVGTSTISWGTPTTSGGEQSSYNFAGNGGVFVNNGSIDGTVFDLGVFTHNNYPIFDFNFTGADLDVGLDIFDGLNLLASEIFNFTFGHNETSNAEPCDPSGTTICPDVVSIPLAISSSVVNLFGENYTLQLLGFSNTGPGGITTQFITEEGQSNSATLYGTLIKANAPEPSLLALLSLGLIGMGATGRRRKH